MLESQQIIDEVKEPGFLGKTLGRFVYSPRKDVGDTDASAMQAEYGARRGGGGGDEGGLREDISAAGARRREGVQAGVAFYCAELFQELCLQTWRDRPRDGASALHLLRRNALAILLVAVSGIITWESTVDELRSKADRTIIFPLYLPHSVALAVACVWTTAVAPGNFIGLYFVRLFMIWRGYLGFTSVNTGIMLLVSFLATVQSHIGAFFLRKFLCANGVKKIPTIDSVAEAVWYLATVFFLSLAFGMVIALCITATPLILWSSFWRYWSTWWLGVLATMITVTPLLTHLLAWDYESSLRSPGRLVECVGVTLATSSVLVVVFFLNFEHFHPLPYLCFPLITWTAFRFNRIGWALTVSLLAYCCALGSVRKRGALYRLSSGDSVASPSLVIQVELFSCVIGVVGITLAAAVREKKNLTRRLHQLNVELEQAVDMRTLELRKANEELKISQKRAEQASHAKSDFLANMSHEIRTPIHGILGLTALLLESELTSDQEESLVSVKECADLLLHIINSVLDLAKIEAGRLEVEKVPFNMRKMVSSTFRMLQARAQQRGLQLLWDVEKSVPQTLVGDVGKLQQCLINLVGNALKFTHEGSVTVRVSVAAEHSTTSLNSDDELGNKVVGAFGEMHGNAQDSDIMVIEFEVRDTGIGISQEKLLDMFKPFTQADASTSRLYGGTGLGLCIVQRFVELLGGSIWAESELGKGSAFHFRLPFRLNSPKDSPPEMSPKVADKVSGRQPWSLMGGLIFNPPGKHPSESSSGVEASNANLCSRGRSANDLLGLWNDNRDDDPDGNNSAPVMGYATLFRDSFRGGGLTRQSSSQGSDLAWTSSPERVQGVFSVSEHRRLEKAQSDPAPARSDRPFVPSPLKWDSMPSDRSVSNEVTQLRQRDSLMVSNTSQGNPEAWELVQPQKFVSASSQTSSTFSEWGVGPAFLRPHEGPMDSEIPNGEATSSGAMERDGGNVTGSAAVNAQANARGESASVRSDLSRESSAELEKMLVNKVSLKILLAEDNAINQKVASRQLEKHGHMVTIVGDGQQALDVISCQHDEFDLVLMDVQMPVMDGLKATTLIRKAENDNGWTRLPVLGLTAHAIQGYQDTCFKHGMDGYLGKPFDIHQLLKTIGHLLPPETFGPRE